MPVRQIRLRSECGQMDALSEEICLLNENPVGAHAHDNRETVDDARRGLLSLQLGFRRHEVLAERADALEVASGSALAHDRDAATYNPVPDLVFNILGTALDHLHGLQVSVEGSGGSILAMSSFTLIRSTFEAAGTGLWILQPESRDERLLRSRRITRDNRRQVHVMKTELGQPDPGFDRMGARLQQQIDARPALAGQSLNKLDSVTSRLGAVATMVPCLPVPPLTLWRMASGIAHGNTHMIIAVLEREQIKLPDEGSTPYNVTSSFVTVAMFYDAALNMVEALLDLYDARNRAPGHA